MGAKPISVQLKQLCHINKSLISLKLILFIFYGGLACLYASLTPHMLTLGLNYYESRIILIVAPAFSMLGPFFFGPLADRLANKKQSASGKYLRVMTAITMLLAAIFYALLLTVPNVQRSTGRLPKVNFGCDLNGAIVFQERCSEEKTCYHWNKEIVGELTLTNCSYTCQNPMQFENLYSPWLKVSDVNKQPELSKEKSEDYDYDDNVPIPSELKSASAEQRINIETGQVYVEPPHLCIMKKNNLGVNVVDRCHVYTEDVESVLIHATLHSATNQENDTHSAEWCNYPLDGFQCNIPEQQANWMKKHASLHCVPMIECAVLHPYDSPNSLLAESQCIKVIGDVALTFWPYLFIRIIADIFTTATVTLLNTAIIIATRETSTGRGDVGRQLAFGCLGWGVLPYLNVYLFDGVTESLILPVIIFCVCILIAAITLISDKNMPVSPPEWWWHTKSGMLAIPMSAIRKYGPEIVALTFVTVILGVFWSVIDSYQLWHFLELNEFDGRTIIAFTLTVAAIPAIFLLWNSETIVDYCGHSNILICAFTIYILRYTGLALIDTPWWALFIAAMEPITLGLTWVTIILYMRHLLPRRLITCGQALPVIAFFCIGKSIGAMFGFVENGTTLESLQSLYFGMAIAACIFAAIYFLLYHCVLAPKCAARMQPPPPPSVLQGHSNVPGVANANGNYAPLRVYHNALGRKGQFRY